MWTAILTGINALSGVVQSFFGFKSNQGQVITEALRVVGDTSSSNAAREAAIAQIISSEANSGYWLAAVWRPMTAVILLGMVVASFFGLTPPHLNDKMSPMLEEIFGLLKICIMGYIPARSVEKIISSVNVGKILQKFIEKKWG